MQQQQHTIGHDIADDHYRYPILNAAISFPNDFLTISATSPCQFCSPYAQYDSTSSRMTPPSYQPTSIIRRNIETALTYDHSHATSGPTHVIM